MGSRDLTTRRRIQPCTVGGEINVALSDQNLLKAIFKQSELAVKAEVIITSQIRTLPLIHGHVQATFAWDFYWALRNQAHDLNRRSQIKICIGRSAVIAPGICNLLFRLNYSRRIPGCHILICSFFRHVCLSLRVSFSEDGHFLTQQDGANIQVMNQPTKHAKNRTCLSPTYGKPWAASRCKE